MRKNLSLSIAAAAVIIAAVGAYILLKPAPAKAPGAIDLPAAGYVEHASYYDITADYATSTSLTEPANTAAVALMQRFVSDTIKQFKSDGNFVNLTARDIAVMGLGPDKKMSLKILYFISLSPHTIAYVYTIYADTLGAHGNTLFKTFVFDTNPSTSSGQAGAPLALADLFVPGAQYLDTLSTLSRPLLAENMAPYGDSAEIATGTTPDDKNFANFFFDNDNLVLVFPPYQVGPYSAGPQTIRIPVSELSNILKPVYR